MHFTPLDRSRTRAAYDMAGVGLDAEAAEKIFWRNAARLVPGSDR